MHIVTSRRLASLLFAALIAVPALANAQVFPGSFPRPLAPSTYVSTGTPCPGGVGTTRAFTDYQFNVSTAGSYTFTVVRRAGTGLRIDAFTGTFNPLSTCTNWIDGTTSATATDALTTNLAAGAYTLIIAGTSAADAATFDVTVTGPASSRLQPICTNSTVVPATQLNVVAVGANASTVITPATGCWFWNTSNVPSWIPNFPASGAGPTTVNYSVATNPTTSARSQTITVGYESRDATGANPQAGSGTSSLMVSQLASATACTFTLTTTTAAPGSGASSSSFMMTAAPATCTWTAESNVPWLTGVSASGTGNKTFNYSVLANPGVQRVGTITAGGQTFTVTQANGCTYVIAPTTSSPTAAGGPLSFTVTPSDASCPWTATTASAAVSGLTASGTGTGTVNFTLAANPGLQRVITITAAGKTYTATQANGCAFTVASNAITDNGIGGVHSFALTASDPLCPWTATDNATWITAVTASGTGSGTVSYTTGQNLGAQRVGVITAGGIAVTVTQLNGCGFALVPNSLTIAANSGGGTFMVTAAIPACTWTATSGTAFISSVTPSGTGTGSVAFGTTANTGPQRTGTITAAGLTFNLTQSDGCAYTLSAISSNPAAGGGAGSVMVTASNAACVWTTSNSNPWITGLTAGATGNANVAFTVAANTGPARTGTITIAGQTYTVNQASGCTFALMPTSAATPNAGGTSSFAIMASSALCPWAATTSDPWISGVTANGTGTGVVNYTSAPNSGGPRTGTITAGGQTFTLTQTNGCSFTLSASMGNVSAAGQSSTVFVTASAPACMWTATKTDAWITSLTASGTGSGVVAFTAAATTGPARTATLTVAGLPFTVNQASGCVFTSVPSPVDVTPAGGAQTVAVTASNAACTWTAASADPWINNLTGGATGDGSLMFTVPANAGAPRTGSISVGGQPLAVNQAGGCTISLASSTATVATSGDTSVITVTATDQSCTWTASTTDSWLSVTAGALLVDGGTSDAGFGDGGFSMSGTGSGDGSVVFTAEPNTGATRTGTISVGGKTFTVTQNGGCAYTLTPTGETVPSAGSQSTFLLAASDQSCMWTASSTDSWLTSITPSGTGNGPISYTAGANSGLPRTGMISVGGQTFTVMQPGVLVKPIVTRQPTAVTVQVGATIQLTVEAIGGALTYQWQKDGVDLPGATMPTLTITGSTTDNAGDYTVVVTNAAGTTTSDPAHVTVSAQAVDGGTKMDAAASGDGGGTTPDSGKSGGGGGGCGCRTSGEGHAPAWQLGLLGLIGVVLVRRRRRR